MKRHAIVGKGLNFQRDNHFESVDCGIIFRLNLSNQYALNLGLETDQIFLFNQDYKSKDIILVEISWTDNCIRDS